ncbi:monooxygenase [Hylemonella gracilis]|uniref:Monooxygenase n=1 Tax=Hylemonella gracilis TaxID=80880 RepID=A0A4P6UNP2_9BURK|nr:FAD-dependent monooxygenase [Hylemonella gracilis]QBK05735.1 monooxygenase [Hylemonella gracilis]
MQAEKNSSTQSLSTQVAIVGGGPVGMGLAIELGQRGIHCVLIERYREPQPIPKGQNLTQRTMEHFHFWGAEPALRAARTIPPDYGIGGLTAYGSLLGPYHYDWMQRELVRPYYYKANERLPQYATEAVLRARVAQLPTIQVRYGWRVDQVKPGPDAVEVIAVAHEDAAEASGARQLTIHADYMVGCDGSRSLVRAQAGITQTLSDHDRMMVLLVFRSHQLHELLKRYPGKSYYNVLQPELDGYWKFFGRVDLGETWFFHAPVPPGTTRDNFDFRAYLHQAVGAEFDVEFQHVGFWDLRFAIADSYRSGRVFVAGDAAHSHPPYGGYGVNTGFEDARNLGWKLAAALQGWGGKALLDSYDQERRPVFESTARDFIAKSIETDRQFLRTFDPERDRAAFEQAWQGRSAFAVGEVHAFEPNYEGSPIVDEPGSVSQARTQGGSAIGTHTFQARAGHHLAPAQLSARHQNRNVYETLGSGFTLLAFGAAADKVQALKQTAQAMGLPLTVVEDAAQGECQRYEASLILVRPDHFVAWSDTAAQGQAWAQAQAVLRQACGLDVLETVGNT